MQPRHHHGLVETSEQPAGAWAVGAAEEGTVDGGEAVTRRDAARLAGTVDEVLPGVSAVGMLIADTAGEVGQVFEGHALSDRQAAVPRQRGERVVCREQLIGLLLIDIVIPEARQNLQSDLRILSDKICMIIQYSPGSLVTRHQPAIAAARVICPYMIPVAVVTNGEDAHLLNSISGERIGEGLESIPSKKDLAHRLKNHDFSDVSIKMVEMANKIIYAFEVDGSCPCDTDICRLP